MSSLDVDPLFTSIPLEETINICTNLLYSNENVIKGINKSEFKNLLSLAAQELYFIFNDVLYKQKDDLAFRSSLGPTMQMFSCHFMKSNGVNSVLRNLN